MMGRMGRSPFAAYLQYLVDPVRGNRCRRRKLAATNHILTFSPHPLPSSTNSGGSSAFSPADWKISIAAKTAGMLAPYPAARTFAHREDAMPGEGTSEWLRIPTVVDRLPRG